MFVMFTFDWSTFIISVSSSVFLALVIDWAKATSKKIIERVKTQLGRWWRREA